MDNRLGEHYQRYQRPNFVEHNNQSFQHNNYTNVYAKEYNQQLSTANEPSIEYEPVDYYLTVSSRDRDTSQYPTVSSYTITFPNEFKNITSIELIQAIIPDQNSVTAEPYLLLKVAEIEDVMVSLDRNMSDAFAILQLSQPVIAGSFIQIDKRIHENTVKSFKVPKASLAKMSITVCDYAGNPFNFGTDNQVPLKALQNTFVFKIVCLEKRRQQLNHRNVF